VRAPVLAATLATLVLASAASCDDPAPYAPSMDRVVALRADGPVVQAWTTGPCEGVTRVVWLFDADDAAPVRQVLDAEQPTTVERLSSDRTPAGFEVSQALPAGFDWRRYERVEVLLDGAEGALGGEGDLAPLADSGAHRGEYHLDDVGWLDEAAVRSGDGTDFLGACTPDPEG